MDTKNLSKTMALLAMGASLVLGGCSSTGSGSGYAGGGVGPSSSNFGKALGSTERTYAYNKSIYLDVAIPVIDPGFPMEGGYIDNEAMAEERIWPEIRRLESKRFSLNIRNALSKTNAFGAVRVVPGKGAAADLYVIGRINESNTKHTKLGITVVDATNKVWGEEDFEIETSSGFYRDSRNEGKDPNKNIYTDIADWVYSLIQRKRSAELENVQLVADMRYAQMYSPDQFNRYLSQKRGIISVNGLPADSDAMLSRIREYKAQDEAFVDGLQNNYDTFYAETEQPYRAYQKESLPIHERIEEEEAAQTRSAIFGVLAGVAAIAAGNQKTHTGNAIAAASAIAAVVSFKNAFDSNDVIQEYTNIYDEMGQNLDLQVSTQVRTFEDTEVELSGTASEQYAQWQAHLREVYQANETPDAQL